MKPINITKAMKEMAAENDFYIQLETITTEDSEGWEHSCDLISISEECSDFLIEYAVTKNGLFKITRDSYTDYVAKLPDYIETTTQLKKALKDAISIALEC